MTVKAAPVLMLLYVHRGLSPNTYSRAYNAIVTDKIVVLMCESCTWILAAVFSTWCVNI